MLHALQQHADASAHVAGSCIAIGDAGAGNICCLVEGCHELHELDISSNKIDPTGAELLARQLAAGCCSLQVFNMCGNIVSRAGAMALACHLA